MKPNQSLEIQLSDSAGRPVHVGNIVVDVNFFTGGNHRYALRVGRTDERGHLSAPYREIDRIRRENAEHNLMDYNTKLDDCDDTVKVVIPNQAELIQQYDRAVRGYGEPPGWASAWPSNAKVTADDKSVRLTQPVTLAQVVVS